MTENIYNTMAIKSERYGFYPTGTAIVSPFSLGGMDPSTNAWQMTMRGCPAIFLRYGFIAHTYSLSQFHHVTLPQQPLPLQNLAKESRCFPQENPENKPDDKIWCRRPLHAGCWAIQFRRGPPPELTFSFRVRMYLCPAIRGCQDI